MRTGEIEAIRKAADEIWEIARRLERAGLHEAAGAVKEASDFLHKKGRDSVHPDGVIPA